MNALPRVDIADVFARGKPIDEAMNEAVRQVVERHRRAGAPLVVWRNGRVVEIAAETISPEKTADNGADLAHPWNNP